MKLPFKIKMSYGIGAICDNALYTLIGTYLLLFLTTVAGVSPAMAGTIVAIGPVWEAICGPIVGFKSDGMVSRYGRRKPFLLTAAVPVAIVTSLLFTSIDASPTVKAIYYIVVVLMFFTTFATFFVPYMAWGSDLTEDYNERTVLRSYAYVFNQVGMCIGMVLPTMIVDYCMNLGRTVQQSWQIAAVFVGVCGSAALLYCALSIHTTDVKDFQKPEKREKFLDGKSILKMFGEYLNILKLRPIQYIIGASLMYLVANITFSSDRVFFMTYNLELEPKMISAMLMVITINGIVMVPFISKLATKFEKKSVFVYVMGGSGTLMIFMRLIGIESLTALVLTLLFYAAANACYWQLMPSMLYDVCAAEELMSGDNHSGAVISLQALSESLSIAVSVQILGIILDVAGFESEAVVQTETAMSWIESCFAFIPGLFMILAAILIHHYPINKENFARIMGALDRRKQGEQVNMEEFQDIFK